MTLDTDSGIDTAAAVPDGTSDAANYSDSDVAVETTASSVMRPRRRVWRLSTPSQAVVIGVVLLAALAAIAGWLGWQDYQHRSAEQVRAKLLQGGRQGALNLTTIDWQRIDNDTQRILASSTGTFHDEFAQRLKAFADVVKQAQSKSEGTLTAAGLESSSGNAARVLVAVNVKISNAGAPEETPRVWRMRISVQKIGDDVKMSNVEFVP